MPKWSELGIIQRIMFDCRITQEFPLDNRVNELPKSLGVSYRATRTNLPHGSYHLPCRFCWIPDGFCWRKCCWSRMTMLLKLTTFQIVQSSLGRFGMFDDMEPVTIIIPSPISNSKRPRWIRDETTLMTITQWGIRPMAASTPQNSSSSYVFLCSHVPKVETHTLPNPSVCWFHPPFFVRLLVPTFPDTKNTVRMLVKSPRGQGFSLKEVVFLPGSGGWGFRKMATFW